MTAAYYIVVVTTHDLVQRPALRLQRTYGVERVHFIILAVFLVILLGLGVRHRRRLLGHDYARRMMWLGSILLIASGLVVSFLMVRSIEIIHFVQYALFTISLLALFHSPFACVLVASAAGVMDEAWQYFFLYPNQPYFDFNDVVMNTVGVLIGLWTFMLYRPKARVCPPEIRSVLTAWVGLLLIVTGLFAAGTFSVYEIGNGIALHRRPPPTRERPVRFVRTNKWGNTSIRLHPGLGVGITFLLPLVSIGFLYRDIK